MPCDIFALIFNSIIIELIFVIYCQVVGIEMNASAVSDAHRNAEINGIKNCRFVCGKVRYRIVAFSLLFPMLVWGKERIESKFICCG